jgi:hypothetical protein
MIEMVYLFKKKSQAGNIYSSSESTNPSHSFFASSMSTSGTSMDVVIVSETCACLLGRRYVSNDSKKKRNNSLPCLFKHMPLQSEYNISLHCFLFEIEDSFEVSLKFWFVGGSGEWNVNMFPSKWQ